MQSFEYKVIPAPQKAPRAKGAKGTDGRFAQALSDLMNEMAAEGWEYLRAEALPCEERTGLTTKTTVYVNMLVFRRLDAVQDTRAPEPPRAADPWERLAMEAAEAPDRADGAVVDLLHTRRALSPPASPAALRPPKAAE